jgi:glutathione S-transferase
VERLTLVIANKNYSSWSLRPWLAMRQAGIPFTEILLSLSETPEAKAAFQKYSPSRRVPGLPLPKGKLRSFRIASNTIVCL